MPPAHPEDGFRPSEDLDMQITTVHDEELITVIAEDYGTDVPLPRQYAHFFSKTAHKPAELVLTDSPSLGGFETIICVSGKVEARQIAKKRNAIVWNF